MPKAYGFAIKTNHFSHKTAAPSRPTQCRTTKPIDLLRTDICPLPHLHTARLLACQLTYGQLHCTVCRSAGAPSRRLKHDWQRYCYATENLSVIAATFQLLFPSSRGVNFHDTEAMQNQGAPLCIDSSNIHIVSNDWSNASSKTVHGERHKHAIILTPMVYELEGHYVCHPTLLFSAFFSSCSCHSII